jgi:hypothetical protein
MVTMIKTYNPWVSKFLALDISKIQNVNPLGNEFHKKINNFKNIYIYDKIPSGIMMINDIQEKG